MVLLFLLFVPAFIRILFELFWRFSRKRFIFDTENGQAWCLITGSGNGLGLEYAKLFAEKGYNLLLLSSLEKELFEAKTNIFKNLKEKQLSEIKIKILKVDFSQPEICYQIIEEFLRPRLKDIAVLLNNVGTDGQHCDYFDIGNCKQRNRLMIDVNLLSITKMLELVLPEMKNKDRGLIISISSGAALTDSPLLATYSSTKAYIRTLMNALSIENRNSGLTFVTFCPYWVSTNLTNNVPTNFFTPNAQTYAKESLSNIRYTESIQTIGYWPHRILYALTKSIGIVGGKQLEQLYLHWLMIKIREFRKKLASKNN